MSSPHSEAHACSGGLRFIPLMVLRIWLWYYLFITDFSRGNAFRLWLFFEAVIILSDEAQDDAHKPVKPGGTESL
jgi:hypothetical protein